MTRRLVVQLMLASSDFWNRRSAEDWSVDEVQKLLHDSPWARPTNADFDTDLGAPALQVAPGGQVKAPEGPGRRRQPVEVIWESGQPILDARRAVLGPQFSGRYVISVGELPLAAMQKTARGGESGESSADRLRRMGEELSAAATLEARGKTAVQPGIVEASKRSAGTWLFGFSRELLDLDRDDRDVMFTLRTPHLTLRAKFEPKQMVYRGLLAL